MQSKSSTAPEANLRVFVTLPASYTLARAADGPVLHRCRTRSIALDRIVIEASDVPALDSKVHLNIPGIDVFSGRVSKTFGTGFVVAIALEPAAIAKLMPRLGWLKRYLSRQISNNREHPRYLLPPHTVQIRTEDGSQGLATLQDMSRSGLAIVTAVHAPVGTRVTLGGLSGTVARLFDGGLALAIEPPRPVEEIRDHLMAASLGINRSSA